MYHAAHADTPVPFGYKCSWLAIRSAHPRQVIGALGLRDVRRSNWHDGIEAAYRGSVFVSPVIDEWILVVSVSLPWPERARYPDSCSSLLLWLGQQFQEVQFFATHRVVEFHAWARVVHGEIVRQYAFSGDQGEVYWDTGPETPQEIRMRLEQIEQPGSFDTGEQGEWHSEADAITAFMPGEADVMYMASVWSVDPTTLDGPDLKPSLGYVGIFRK